MSTAAGPVPVRGEGVGERVAAGADSHRRQEEVPHHHPKRQDRRKAARRRGGGGNGEGEERQEEEKEGECGAGLWLQEKEETSGIEIMRVVREFVPVVMSEINFFLPSTRLELCKD